MTAQLALEMFVLFCVCICVVAMAIIGGHAYGKYVMKEPKTAPEAMEYQSGYTYAPPPMAESSDSAQSPPAFADLFADDRNGFFKPQVELIRSDKANHGN